MPDDAKPTGQEEDVFDPSETEDSEVGSSVRYLISSYGADHPVDGLVKRIDRGDIYVPEFQRGYVWNHGQASRFVESLLLGLPVPGIFLFKEPDTQKLVVVDGQQRLRTLQFFYEGLFLKKEFILKGVCDELQGKTAKTLSEEDRRRLDDAIIHATIFQQDDPHGDRSSVYLIFERLNTGGTPLSPQEIRSCVYRGSLNDLLNELADDENWREIYGPPSRRAKDQELILRFLALLVRGETYTKPMKQFLNDFMEEHRQADDELLDTWRCMFRETAKMAAGHLGRGAFRPERNLNAAVLDALLVGLATRLASGPLENPDGLRDAVDVVLKNDSFLRAVSSATTDEESLKQRLSVARTEMSQVQ